MDTGHILLIILFGVICIVAIFVAVKMKTKKEAPPQIRKAPVHHVSVAYDDKVDDSYLKAYELDWKPVRDSVKSIPENIEKILQDIETISPLVTDLSSKLNDPDINPKDIAKLIVTDQGLTSFILKRVNSPYYRLAQKVDNIFSAIVILGYNEIYRIVMEERTSRIGIKPSKEEWVHANLTSTIAAYISSTSRIGVPGGTMVTLGMLHDIAKTIMRQSLPQPEAGFSSDPRERLRQENELYGIDHAALGGYLARKWKMPDRLSNAIEQHHWPMFWPVREIGQVSPDIMKELAVLSISDIAARNFLQEISGIYLGDDYYRFIKKTPKIESILVPEITRDLNRIKHLGGIKGPDSQEKQEEPSE